MSYDAAEIVERARATPLEPQGIASFYQWLSAYRGGVFFSETFPPPQRIDRARPAHAGKLITCDGISGAGKNTQIQRLAEKMRAAMPARECRVLVTKTGNPFRGPLIDYWRAHPQDRDTRVEVPLLWAGRKYFVEEVLATALAAPECVVVQNRSCLSDVSFTSRDEGELIRNLSLCFFDPVPDLALYLEIDPTSAHARVTRRAAEMRRTLAPQEQLAVLERTARVYGWIFAEHPGAARRVDASGIPDEVQARIWAEVETGF